MIGYFENNTRLIQEIFIHFIHNSRMSFQRQVTSLQNDIKLFLNRLNTLDALLEMGPFSIGKAGAMFAALNGYIGVYILTSSLVKSNRLIKNLFSNHNLSLKF